MPQLFNKDESNKIDEYLYVCLFYYLATNNVNMKKILMVLTCVSILLFSCSKTSTNTNNSNNSVNNGVDSSLLFSLNVASSGYSDSSVYGNSIVINNSSSRVVSLNGINYLEFGTQFDSLAIANSLGSADEPNIFSNLPIGKLTNKVTLFFDLLNSTNTADTSSYTYGNSYANYVGLSIGLPARSSSTGPKYASNPMNFYYSYGLRNTSWYRRIDFQADAVPCNSYGHIFEQSDFFDSTAIPSMPFSTTYSKKFTVVIDGAIVKLYIDGSIVFSEVSNRNISFNNLCSQYGLTFAVIRGSLLKNLKVWNKALNITEINNL